MDRHQPDGPSTDAAEREWLDHWTRGPRRTRWEQLPVQIGDLAPDLELVDARGEGSVRLASLWMERPAVLLFWRHFGCSCGRDRAARLLTELDGYRAHRPTIALIGQGEPERARVYAAANGIPEDVALLCDPDERSYRAYGLLEGTATHVLFDAPDDYLECDAATGGSLAEKRRLGGRPMVDNPWLLPGEFVVRRGGAIELAYRYQYCEGYPDPRVIVAALRFATGDLSPRFTAVRPD